MPAKFTILLVDDDPDIADILNRVSSQSFTEASYIQVRNFAEAETYLDKLDGLGPNIVLLDIHLSIEPSGLEFLSLMRKHPIGCSVPIIMLTGTTSKALAKEAYRRGATAFTLKPFSYSDWKAYVQELRAFWYLTATVPRFNFGR